jgi:hypothetical protein
MSPPFADREAALDAITRFVLGQSSAQETEAVTRLLAEEPAWNEELEGLQGAVSLLPYAAAVTPPPHLKARILQAAREGPAVRRPRVRPWWPLLAAAATLAAVSLLVQNASLRRELQTQREVAALLQQPNVVLAFDMKGTGTEPDAFGSVALDLDAKKGAVVLRKLPALPPEKVYRLWALVGDQPVPCGQFNANPANAVVSLFPVPVDAYTAPVTRLLLTVEPAAAPKRPEGPTVMIGSVVS